MKTIIKERKFKIGTRVTMDVVILAKDMQEKPKDALFNNLSEIFCDAYREGVLLTSDYFALCDIAIKKIPTISYHCSCDLAMTADRVVIKLLDQKEKYIKCFEECFKNFYGGN